VEKVSYHGIVTDMLPSSGSRITAVPTNTAVRSGGNGSQQATFMSSLDQGNQEQAVAIDAAPSHNETQAQPDATAQTSGSTKQTQYNAVESRRSQELKTAQNQPTRERSMANFASMVDIAAYQKPAATSTSGSYRFISSVSPIAAPKTTVSPGTLAALRAVNPSTVAVVPPSLDVSPPQISPSAPPPPVVVSPPQISPSAPPPPVVVEEPWYKTPTGMAVAGIGILALLAGGYALYKSQGT